MKNRRHAIEKLKIFLKNQKEKKILLGSFFKFNELAISSVFALFKWKEPLEVNKSGELLSAYDEFSSC